MRKQKSSRKLLAFLFAPLVPSLYLVSTLDGLSQRWMVFVLIISILFSYLPCFFLGSFVVGLLKKLDSLNTLNVALCGALFGMVVFYLFGVFISIILGSSKSMTPTFWEMMTGALLGISVALPFGLISGFPMFGSTKEEEESR